MTSGYIQLGTTILIVAFLAMTLAYLAGAQQTGAQVSGIVKYPINGQLNQFRPHFEDKSSERRFHLQEDYPPCPFSTQCFCSNTGPDLGLVFCSDVELGRIPAYLNNTKFHTLTLRNNRLRYIDEYAFYGTGMYRLEIRHNLLFSLPEKALWGVERSIWQLDLRHNQLSQVPSAALFKLRKLSLLDLTGNRISDLTKDDFEGLETSLKTLILAENSIMNLPSGVFSKLRSVQSIDLRENNIHFISDRAFQGVSTELIHINLANNLLSTIPFETLSEVSHLQTLNLARNRITKIFKTLFSGYLSMDTLILDMNEIESLEPFSFQNFGYINRTSLRGNPLTLIENDAFRDSKIRELYLHDCLLSSVAEGTFRGLESSLQVLDMSYNNLSFLPEKVFLNLDSVRSLSLSYNKLSMNPKTSFNGFKYSLQHLNLLGEDMGDFPVESLKEIRNVRTLGLSTLPDPMLSKNDFLGFGPAVEKLYLHDNGISSISANAFEHVPGVKILDLSFNSIGTMDRDAFVNIGGGLEELRIVSGFSMTHLPPQPFVHLNNLKKLDISNNELNQVDGECFRYMRNLRKLILQDNKIRQLTKDHFQGQFHPYLEYIKLSYNSIDTIESQTFHDYKTLHSIYLNDNMITKLNRFAFLNLESLQYLYLEGNNINDLSFESFQNLPKLRFLDLSFNQMTNLNLDAFEQVGTLSSLTIDASHNKISTLKINGSAWNSYSGIKMLVFSNNNISSIAPNYFESVRSSIVHVKFDNNIMRNISGEIFENMQHLRLLNVANNLIENVNPKAFQGSTSIQYLNFRHNRIMAFPATIFKGQENLRHIDISFNAFRNIPGELFAESPIEILRASNNRIRKFPDLTLQKYSETLRIIDIANNEITALKSSIVNRLQNLVSLDISHNHIKTIEPRAFHMLWNLVSLDISHNPIKKLDQNSFDGLQGCLKDLKLANLTLNVLPTLKFERLLELNISSNKISFLPTKTLANISSLRVLDLSHNDLQTAANSVWQELPRLQWLLLKGNPITSLSNDSFIGLQRLEKLDIQQLPLHNFESGTLNSMENLRELSITTQPLVHNFNIGRAMADAPSIHKLNLEVEGRLDSQLHGSPLSYKLSNITLSGRHFTKLSDNALQMLRSRELKLSIHHTSLQVIPREFFRNLGKVRFIALAALNNSLQTLGDPSSTLHPGEPESVFLTDLRIDGTSWKCDCGIGWMESWMKSWRSFSCSVNDDNDECEGALRSLRSSRCETRGPRSLMEALKKDLECGATSGVAPTRLRSLCVMDLSVLIIAFVYHILKSEAA